MTMVVQNWSELSDQAFDLEAIKAIHQPHDHYLFRANTHQPGASSVGGSSRSHVYALSGGCAYWLSGESESDAVIVDQGQRIWLPEAPVNFRVGLQSEFQCVLVVEVPEEFRGKGYR